MSTYQLFEQVSLPTTTDLSTSQYYAVAMDSNGAAVIATAAKNIAGILQNTPKGTGEAASVGVRGKTRAAITDSIVAIGAPLEVASGGTLVNHASGVVVALADETGTTGQVISVTLLTSAALMA